MDEMDAQGLYYKYVLEPMVELVADHLQPLQQLQIQYQSQWGSIYSPQTLVLASFPFFVPIVEIETT